MVDLTAHRDIDMVRVVENIGGADEMRELRDGICVIPGNVQGEGVEEQAGGEVVG